MRRRVDGGYRWGRHSCLPFWMFMVSFCVMSWASPAVASHGHAIHPDSSACLFGRVELVWSAHVPKQCESDLSQIARRLFRGPVDQNRLSQGMQGLLSTLADAGYRNAVISPRDFSLNSGRLGLHIVIEPGSLVRVENWEFAGLSRTDTTWLARALDCPVGVPATRALLDRVVERFRGISALALTAPPEIVLQSQDSTATVRLHLSERRSAVLGGALAMAGGQERQSARSLAGRFSLSFSGLFHRDRAMDLRYEHPRPDEMLLRFGVGESRAFGSRFDWRLDMEDWERAEHRQAVDVLIACALGSTHDVRIETGGGWRKITPGHSTTAPARVEQMTFGLAHGRSATPTASFTTPATSWAVQITSSHRREWPGGMGPGLSRWRTRLDAQHAQTIRLAPGFFGTLRVAARQWWTKESILSIGDEWFLGGPDMIRGYEARSIAASSGVTTSLELTTLSGRGIGAAVFGDAARLRLLGPPSSDYSAYYSYGAALLLSGADRTGRLEVAWRDRAAWADGIVRLSIIQGW